jgi:long-chain acyl-CoA synthetase
MDNSQNVNQLNGVKHKLVDITSLLPQFKNKLAIIDTSHSPPLKITYEELNNLVARFCNYLNSQNHNSENLKVGIFLENSINFVATLISLFQSGYIAVPISLKATENTINSISQECSFVFCNENTKLLLPKETKYVLVETALSKSDISNRKNTVLFSDEALILYTSGSTGEPKGVIHTHSGLGWKIQTSALEVMKWTKDLNIINYLASPLYHMNGLSSLLVMLNSYCSILLTPIFNPVTASKVIQENNVQSLIGVPAMASQIIDYAASQTYPSVKWIKLGSSPVAEKLMSQIHNNFPNANIQNYYGLTEVGPNLFGDHPHLSRPKFSVGYPLHGIEYRIIDGILQIKSPSQFKTYSTGQNSESKFTKDGFYITNDLFRKDENDFYYFQGRSDDMIVCGGENIHLGKISQLLESHPYVSNAVTISLKDDIKGEKPYAFVIPKMHIQAEELKIYLQKYLTINAIPRKIWFVNEIPKNELGKLCHEKLKVMAEKNLKTT